LLRADPTRELSFDSNPAYEGYETTEWITVTAGSDSLSWIDVITLSYFYTVDARDLIGEQVP
jgi:hypothetical protein